MANPPLIGRLRQRAGDMGRSLGRRALEELLTDEQRNEAMDLAARGVQEGRRFLDARFEQLFGALGLATQADLERVARKIGKLRRRLESIVDEVAEHGETGAPAAPLDVPASK